MRDNIRCPDGTPVEYILQERDLGQGQVTNRLSKIPRVMRRNSNSESIISGTPGANPTPIQDLDRGRGCREGTTAPTHGRGRGVTNAASNHQPKVAIASSTSAGFSPRIGIDRAGSDCARIRV